MLRTFLLDALLLTSLASAVALSPVKRQTGGVGIVFSGCDADQTAIINNALNDAVKMAYGIMGIDTKTDIGAFDFFGPNMATSGVDAKIHNVYMKLGSYQPVSSLNVDLTPVNAFCPSEDKNLWNNCKSGAAAFEWDTLCRDGRCPCSERNSDQSCKRTNATNWIYSDAVKSYTNIQFCDGFFQLPTLDKVLDDGKGAEKEKKYNLNTYWQNTGRVLFHLLFHGSRFTMAANDGLMISDLKIKIPYDNKPDERIEAPVYGPLLAKILARIVSNETPVRRSDDNWTAYALAKYVQAKLGFYPILPLADGEAWFENKEKPKALFLTLSKTGKTVVNLDLYNSDTLATNVTIDWVTDSINSVNNTIDEWTIQAKGYPDFYNDRLKKARAGDYDGTASTTQPTPTPTPTPTPKPSDPPKNDPPAPKVLGRTLQVFAREDRTMTGNPSPSVWTWDQNKHYSYQFVIGEAGKGSNPCINPGSNDAIPMWMFDAPKDVKSLPKDRNIIDGEWILGPQFPDLGECKFQGIGKVGPSGDNGWLLCSDRPNIKCTPDTREIDRCEKYNPAGRDMVAVSHCDY